MTDQDISRQIEADLLYLDLLKQVLTRTGLQETYRPLYSRNGSLRSLVNPFVKRSLDALDLELHKRIDPSVRREGRDWPSEAETMIGMDRLDNLQHCVIDVLEAGIPGDFIETGVWRGGATILIRAVLKVRRVTDRTVWVADSFQGLPKPDPVRYPADQDDPHWTNDTLAVSLDEVKANFAKYRLLDNQVRFLPGWFRDTLSAAPIERLAVIRLDGDMYESTIIALEALYPKLSRGGYVIVDDYNAIAGCRKAVQDYRSLNGIDDKIMSIDWSGVFWQKTTVGGGAPNSAS